MKRIVNPSKDQWAVLAKRPIIKQEELTEIVKVLEEHPNLMIVSDDIYNQLSFNESGLSPHILNIKPEFFDRCISINGMSFTIKCVCACSSY